MVHADMTGDMRLAPQMIQVPCGKCFACLAKRRQDWVFRLENEFRQSTTSWFITLTYDDEHLPKDNLGKKDHVQRFLKRLRKKYSPMCSESHPIRYFAVSDYGGQFGRIHYHMLLFNFPLTGLRYRDLSRYLEEIWQNGIVDVGRVTSKSINYVCKYVLKSPTTTDTPKTWMLCSRRPGIGSNYLSQWNVRQLKHTLQEGHFGLVTPAGTRQLPRYYKDKIVPTDDYGPNDLKRHEVQVNIARRMLDKKAQKFRIYVRIYYPDRLDEYDEAVDKIGSSYLHDTFESSGYIHTTTSLDLFENLLLEFPDALDQYHDQERADIRVYIRHMYDTLMKKKK